MFFVFRPLMRRGGRKTKDFPTSMSTLGVTHRSGDRSLGMTMHRAGTAFTLAAVSAGMALATAVPASAGGVGDFLSPAFGTSCANQNTGAHADGATTHGTGAGNGNLAGLPVGSALNQCGGADAPVIQSLMKSDLGAPAKVNAQSVLALLNVGVQDLGTLSS